MKYTIQHKEIQTFFPAIVYVEDTTDDMILSAIVCKYNNNKNIKPFSLQKERVKDGTGCYKNLFALKIKDNVDSICYKFGNGLMYSPSICISTVY